MKTKAFGLLLAVSVALIFMGCPNPATDTPKSTNADLSALTLNTGTLSPVFAAATMAYNVSVGNAVTSITITGTKADSNATISANNGVAQDLSEGTNRLTITVTAQDGTTIKNYEVTVTRTTAWTLVDTGLANATMTPEGANGVRIDISTAESGTDTHACNLYWKDFAIEKGHRYRVSYSAWRSSGLAWGRHYNYVSGPTNNNGSYGGSFGISHMDSATTYSAEFTMNHPSDSKAFFGLEIYVPGPESMHVSDFTITEISDVTPANGTELLVNGDFAQGSDYWTTAGSKSWDFSTAMDGGAIKCDLNASAASYGIYELQYHQQLGMFLDQSAGYRLSFKARATSARSLRVTIQEKNIDVNGDGQMYSSYVYFDPAITTTMQTYTYDFIMGDPSDHNGRIVFALGGSADDVWLDDISLKRIADPLPTPSDYALVYKAGRGTDTSVFLDLGSQGLSENHDNDIASYFSLVTDSGQTFLQVDTSVSAANAYPGVETTLTDSGSWPKNATLIVRAKALSISAGMMGMCVNLAETGMNQSDIRTDGSAGGSVRFGSGGPVGTLNPMIWHTYRITYQYQLDKSYLANVYVDEAITPVIADHAIAQAANDSGPGKFFLGDGSGSSNASCLYDFVVLYLGGAFGPQAKSLAAFQAETGISLE